MNLKTLIDNEFGLETRMKENPVTATVGTSVEEVLSNNPNRVGFTLVNHSVNDLYVANDPELTVSDGIYIAPNGGTLAYKWNEEFNAVGYKLYGIASGAGSSIYVVSLEIRK